MKKNRALLSKNGKILFLSVFSLLLWVFPGCVSSSRPPLVNTVWKPVGKAPEGVHLIFTPDKRRVVGCCGSNRFFGPVKFEGKNQISIGMLGATRMATPLYRYEQKFLDDLKAASLWHIDDTGALILKDIDGRVCMRLEPAEEPGKGKK